MLELVKNKNIVFFAPHADDEIIACGGTLALLSETNNIIIVYLTEASNIRKEEINKAHSHLGNFERVWLDLNEDSFLEDNKRNCITIIDTIQNFKPYMVFLPTNDDEHSDHEMANKIIMKALRMARYYNDESNSYWNTNYVLYYKVWGFLSKPYIALNTSNVFKQKINGINELNSQIQDFDYISYAKHKDRIYGYLHNKKGTVECFRISTI